jgi:hypothetical protein
VALEVVLKLPGAHRLHARSEVAVPSASTVLPGGQVLHAVHTPLRSNEPGAQGPGGTVVPVALGPGGRVVPLVPGWGVPGLPGPGAPGVPHVVLVFVQSVVSSRLALLHAFRADSLAHL